MQKRFQTGTKTEESTSRYVSEIHLSKRKSLIKDLCNYFRNSSTPWNTELVSFMYNLPSIFEASK
jgi:hypothetical protein